MREVYIKLSIYPLTYKHLIKRKSQNETQKNIHTRLVDHVNLLKHCLVPVLRPVDCLSKRTSENYQPYLWADGCSGHDSAAAASLVTLPAAIKGKTSYCDYLWVYNSHCPKSSLPHTVSNQGLRVAHSECWPNITKVRIFPPYPAATYLRPLDCKHAHHCVARDCLFSLKPLTLWAWPVFRTSAMLMTADDVITLIMNLPRSQTPNLRSHTLSCRHSRGRGLHC